MYWEIKACIQGNKGIKACVQGNEGLCTGKLRLVYKGIKACVQVN